MGWFTNGKCTSKVRLDGKTAIITGANTGIGKETALDLATRGATVIMACRNIDKAKEAAEEIKKCGNEKVIIEKLDLSSLQSVRDFCTRVQKNHQNIHLLINNAGVMAQLRELSDDGYEMQFATNHLGHFLLTLLLLPTIIASQPARIVNVSSKIHIFSQSLHFNDINLEKSYGPLLAYSRSKLANILFTRELAHRLKDTLVNVYCLHPGVVYTELSRHVDSSFFRGARWLYNTVGYPFMKSPKQGAQTTLYCAVDEKTANETGLYYDDCKVSCTSALAKNDEVAKELWEVSVKMVNLGDFDPFLSLNK
ncbi:retinol dehydrogenase 11-like [Cimex lectularius]|uniref:Retinol dehydrogenase 11-like n=1 Tax=Cimex lectularius TaxID=79782 RepID=A0A8I6RS88_CIMLE|nr:retinol dehydrogenase 11-like [Cimex lectularius]XP_014251575.1 retinol dehydrogenase 11-like [Cimex lectularius]XP_014251576.1 retinol dehydrogenase 11-like [Cimex lectularius]